jgi:hypothetical protein
LGFSQLALAVRAAANLNIAAAPVAGSIDGGAVG